MSNFILKPDALMNYLIYCYLQESGFTHTAFVFQHESDVNGSSLFDENMVSAEHLIKVFREQIRKITLEPHTGNVEEDEYFVLVEALGLHREGNYAKTLKRKSMELESKK